MGQKLAQIDGLPSYLISAFTFEGEFKVTDAMKNYYYESGYFVVRYMFYV